jgi:hypothetical protein
MLLASAEVGEKRRGVSLAAALDGARKAWGYSHRFDVINASTNAPGLVR